MWSQRRLRDELRFVTEFNTLLDVMQQVVISQLRRLEERVTSEPALMQTLRREIFPLLPDSAQSHPLVRGGTEGSIIVVMTSDEGMVGPLHTNVMRRAMEHADQTTRWIVIGQRGMRLLGDHASHVQAMPMPSEMHVHDQMQRLSLDLLQRYLLAPVRQVMLIAPHFLSPMRQDVAIHQLLPLPVSQPSADGGLKDRIIEPLIDRVLEELAALWMTHVGIEAFWSARRAECAARALHVECARQELAKQAKVVHHEFFKSLHERVDVLVRETCVVQRYAANRLAARPSVAAGGSGLRAFAQPPQPSVLSRVEQKGCA